MNHSDEQQFAYRVRQVLNEGSDALAPKVLARLKTARRKAVDASAETVAVGHLSLAGIAEWTEDTRAGARALVMALVMALALSIGVVSAYYWNQFSEADENVEVDSALLADELPPAAYVDSGFKIWLERVSDSSPQ